MTKFLFSVCFFLVSFYLGMIFASEISEKCHIDAKKVFLYLYYEDVAFTEATKCLDMAPECKKGAEKAIQDMELALIGLKTDLARCLRFATPEKEVTFRPLPLLRPPWYNQQEKVMKMQQIRSTRGLSRPSVLKGVLLYQLYKKSQEKKLPEQPKQPEKKENPSPRHHEHDDQNPKGQSPPP